MVSEIIQSLGQLLGSLGYSVNYTIVDKSNSSKLPLAEFDLQTTTVSIYQTVANINRLNFALAIYHPAGKTDQAAVSSLASLQDMETLKKSLNVAFRAWDITTGPSIGGFCGFFWDYAGQGINKEFAANVPVKMLVLNCYIQYLDA